MCFGSQPPFLIDKLVGGSQVVDADANKHRRESASIESRDRISREIWSRDAGENEHRRMLASICELVFKLCL